MTRIDFYSLADGSRGDRFLLTCRLAERIYHSGQDPIRIHIQIADPSQAEHLDRLLWTYDDQSFLPHGRIGQTDPMLTAILIGDEPLADHDQVLINLDPSVPPWFARFERLCEPLGLEAAGRDAGRERFRYYRDRGYDLHHHKIRL
ncbi:MAG: DNA polymerase III subunit chi [Chromatiaceae bacterium]